MELDEDLPEEGPPAEFDAYTVVFHRRTASQPDLTDEQRTRVMRQHLAYLAGLHRDGLTITHGPLGEDEGRDLRAMTIYRADPGQAMELAGRDPAVRHGLFTLEAMRWFNARGSLRAGANRD